ncbi:hypothetical protein BB559_005598 [Furculomyces boomerangus]|uniref:DDE-1 domain-containing protein n=1 Tax=Furculomyces boomerangus TaxID=61424 RepID=A0A2T9Y7N5_9FUNG|nr:hypothetical protein BB559_005598 [Furculomyces boomerangus]
MDNSPGHPSGFFDGSITVKYLPPNKQIPLTSLDLGRPPHLLDAAELIKEAWENIPETSIENCHKKADETLKFSTPIFTILMLINYPNLK